MKIFNYTVLFSVLIATYACMEEPEFDIDPNPGSEVQFGLSLGHGLDTRTVYGLETTTGFPIYWVDGDEVLVASPQCLSGRNSATYIVSCEGDTQNYASDLTKAGDAGVQWGGGETADFYSIYPALGSTLVVNENGTDVVANLKVAATQYSSTSESVLSTGGRLFYAQPREMGNVMMYAYSPGVENGNTVELKYHPFSTVLEFTIKAPVDSPSATQYEEIIMQSITLQAPEGIYIAGDYQFIFPTPSIENPSTELVETESKSSQITVHFLEGGGDAVYNTVLEQNDVLKVKMCVLPRTDVQSMEGWEVTVSTSAGNFKKTLGAKDSNGVSTKLTPGKVHKLVLPQLEYGSQEWQYDNNDWITSLPDYRNIYLTEISLPGAWYAGAPESEQYQSTSSISELWANGIRAFGVETKCVVQTVNVGFTTIPLPNPKDVVVSGTADNSSVVSVPFGTNSLHTDARNDAPSYKDDNNVKYIQDVIKDIANAISTPEYGVLILSYADGGSGGNRYVDYGAWLNLLFKAYDGLDATTKAKIYTAPITPDTIVDQVIGKLIIKVNVDANIAMNGAVSGAYYNGIFDWGASGKTYTYAYGNNFPALFSFTPFLTQMDTPSFDVPFVSPVSWMTWSDSNTHRTYSSDINFKDFLWCFSSANRTQVDPTGNSTANSTIPTYAQRKAALGTMMAYSRDIYDASTHNVWFYFNCGGTQATSSSSDNPSPTSFATNMNQWLLQTLQAKEDDPSPLGIVMFNRCVEDAYNGPAIVREIIEMNSRFYLKHAGDAYPGATQQLPEGNGAYAFVGKNAF